MVASSMKQQQKCRLQTAILHAFIDTLPITVAAPSNASTVFARWNTRIMGSNPTQGMDVCVRLFCVGSSLATG
jgi:hypothetical protein